MKRSTTISAIASAIICCLLLILLPVSYDLSLSDFDPKSRRVTSRGSIAVMSHFRCGASDGGVWVYSLDCPYTGSIRHISDERGSIFYEGGHARQTRDWGWSAGDYGMVQMSFIGEKGELVGKDRSGDLPGIYYRHFESWKEQRPWWTLRVALWYPIVLFAVLPTMWMIRRGRLWFGKPMPNKCAAADRGPAGESDGSGEFQRDCCSRSASPADARFFQVSYSSAPNL